MVEKTKFIKTNKKIQYCCELMNDFLADSRIAILYSPAYRLYSLPWLQKGRTISTVTKSQKIDYCPWCGKKLPTDLTNRWFEILEKEYHLDDPRSKEQKKLVPAEFHTDKWWKKRGL